MGARLITKVGFSTSIFTLLSAKIRMGVISQETLLHEVLLKGKDAVQEST